jgi:hypothetical protein
MEVSFGGGGGKEKNSQKETQIFFIGKTSFWLKVRFLLLFVGH